MKRIFLIISLISIIGSALAQKDQDKSVETIKWYTFDDIEQLAEDDERFIFIDLYTDWCGWCKRMDATTFKDPSVVSVMNEYFYPVKFNAEYKDTILYRNMVFVNQYIGKSNRPPHQLAVSLLDGQMSYPSFAILDKELNRLTILKGFQTVDALKKTLLFVGEEKYKTMSWEEYNKPQ